MVKTDSRRREYQLRFTTVEIIGWLPEIKSTGVNLKINWSVWCPLGLSDFRVLKKSPQLACKNHDSVKTT